MAVKPSMPMQPQVAAAAPAELPVGTSSAVDEADVNANQGGKTSVAAFNNKVVEKR